MALVSEESYRWTMRLAMEEMIITLGKLDLRSKGTRAAVMKYTPGGYE